MDLCEALASMAKCICSTLVDPSRLDAFTASHLIALDKHPGVHPIGIGEVSRCIIGLWLSSSLKFKGLQEPDNSAWVRWLDVRLLCMRDKRHL